MYMAPEVLSGLAATRRSDVYSMGALLFELCAGVPPYYDVPIDQLPLVVPKRDAPPLCHIAPAVDPRFAAVIDRCLRRNPEERFGSGEQLLSALEEILPTNSEVVPEGNPYRGLWPFEEEHRALFFGRRSEIGTLLERLRSEPCMIIAAESGVGKTSLCRAGILPLVREGLLEPGCNFRTATVTLGRQPLRAFVAGLAPLFDVTEGVLKDRFQADPKGLVDEIRTRLPRGNGLLLFVDQLEELVTCPNPEEGRAVALILSSLCGSAPNLRLLLSVRSDALGRLGSLPGLAEMMSRSLYVLRPLAPERLREVITGPAQAKGVRFDGPNLVSSLVESTVQCEGGLPLLQLVLAELWEAREGNTITQATFDSIGGIDGALTRHADHVIGSMLADRRMVARQVLCTLCGADQTAVSCIESELLKIAPAVPAVLESLVRSRLLYVRSTAEGAAYALSHTALLRWPTLLRWLAEPGTGQIARGGQTGGSQPLPSHEASWLQKRPRYLVIGACTTLMLLGYGAFELRSSLVQRRQVVTHVQQGQRELIVARSLQAELFELQNRAFLAFDKQRSEESEQLLARAHTVAVAADRAYGRASHQIEAALNIDGSRSDLRDTLADILYERAIAAELDHQEGLLDDLIQRLALYDTKGQRRQRWLRPGRITLTSSPTGANVQVARYIADGQRRWAVVTTWTLGSTPLPQVELEPGAYVFILSTPGFNTLRYPRLVGRALDIEQNLDLEKIPP